MAMALRSLVGLKASEAVGEVVFERKCGDDYGARYQRCVSSRKVVEVVEVVEACDARAADQDVSLSSVHTSLTCVVEEVEEVQRDLDDDGSLLELYTRQAVRVVVAYHKADKDPLEESGPVCFLGSMDADDIQAYLEPHFSSDDGPPAGFQNEIYPFLTDVHQALG